MKAKLTGSKPTRRKQSALFSIPLLGSMLTLSTVSAAHQWVPSQGITPFHPGG